MSRPMSPRLPLTCSTPATLPTDLPSPEGKSLAIRSLGGESTKTVRKRLGDPSTRAVLGEAIGAALRTADLSKQEAAYRGGYGRNQSQITRLIDGSARQPLDVLWDFGPEFQLALVIQLARLAGIEVQTVFTVPAAPRKAAV